MSEENKQRLKEHQRNYRKAKKSTSKLLSFSLHGIKMEKMFDF